MKMILEGIRVLDWSVYQAGPFAAALLADLGADVIHLEEPGRGDLLRGVKTSFGVSPVLPQGRNIHVEEHNRNKRGLALNLKHPKSKEVVARLIAETDIFMTNYRLQAAKRFGMDYETLSQHNPRLIYAHSSGFGVKGPDADSPSLDFVAQARAGSLLALTPPDAEPTLGIPNVGDRSCSIFTAFGVLAALIGRDRLGIGQEVFASQLGSMICLQGYTISLALLSGKDVPSHVRTEAPNPIWNSYKCKDGQWIALGGFAAVNWPPFCKAINMPELQADERFESMEMRQENRKELIAIIDDIMATKTRDEWLEIFRNNDVVASRVNRLVDLASDPQVLANDYITEWDHPTLGPMKFVGFPVGYSKTPLKFRMAAPEVGQHTEEILLEVCGYDWDDINKLRDEGVI